MKKYAVCGVSARAIASFIDFIINDFKSSSELVALLDIDPLRFKICGEYVPGSEGVPQYSPDEFDRMLSETSPDAIIVASRDDTHVDYILKALEKNLDVICEKPMVTTTADCRRVLEAEKESKGKVVCTFNYRYPAAHRKIKELILEGKLGRITNIDLNWYIDTYHGASYFKRWNRKRECSGGLSIHKSTHHFDLINWFTDQRPLEVFAYGALNYYGSESELNPRKKDGRHCSECEVKDHCKYQRRWLPRSSGYNPVDDHLSTIKASKQCASYTGYSPDSCIFDSDINIEDTYAAVVKYDKGAVMNYSVNFSCPYEGYSLSINGTRGRIEAKHVIRHRASFPVPEETVEYYPLFDSASKETINLVKGKGGHGGGDPLIREDIFLGEDGTRNYRILGNSLDAAYSIAVGEAVWQSAKSNEPVKIKF